MDRNDYIAIFILFIPAVIYAYILYQNPGESRPGSPWSTSTSATVERSHIPSSEQTLAPTKKPSHTLKPGEESSSIKLHTGVNTLSEFRFKYIKDVGRKCEFDILQDGKPIESVIRECNYYESELYKLVLPIARKQRSESLMNTLDDEARRKLDEMGSKFEIDIDEELCTFTYSDSKEQLPCDETPNVIDRAYRQLIHEDLIFKYEDLPPEYLTKLEAIRSQHTFNIRKDDNHCNLDIKSNDGKITSSIKQDCKDVQKTIDKYYPLLIKE